MGKLDMKLMQGIEDTENQIQADKQRQNQDTVFVGSQKSQNTQRQSESRKNTKKRKKSENEPNTKPQKQVFSFRAMVSDIHLENICHCHWKNNGKYRDCCHAGICKTT